MPSNVVVVEPGARLVSESEKGMARRVVGVLFAERRGRVIGVVFVVVARAEATGGVVDSNVDIVGHGGRVIGVSKGWVVVTDASAAAWVAREVSKAVAVERVASSSVRVWAGVGGAEGRDLLISSVKRSVPGRLLLVMRRFVR